MGRLYRKFQGALTQDDLDWAREEARRRGWHLTQIIREAVRVYREQQRAEARAAMKGAR